MITAKESYQKAMLYRNIKEEMNHIEECILSAVKSGWTSVRVPIKPSTDIETRKWIISELESLGYNVSYNTMGYVPVLCISW